MLNLYNTGRQCLSCGEIKPNDLFLSLKDNTCKLCRRAIRDKLRYRVNINLSKEVMVSNLTCPTCKQPRALHEFPQNSLECEYCWKSRNYVEYYQRNSMEVTVICLVCDLPKPVTEFPSGGLICKSCIYRANRYKRTARREK